MPSCEILRTPRLLLRYQTPADIPPLIALWRDPDVTRFMGGPRDLHALQTAFDETQANPTAETHDLWPLVEISSGQTIGHCGLLDKEVDGQPEIELVYVLAKSAWGKGRAAEIGAALISHAFENMGHARLIALIEPDNEPSERVALRLGMRLEKEVIRPNGEPRRVYAIEMKD